MTIKTGHDEIWNEYSDGQTYNNSMDLVDTVKKNERFFSGDQWEGVNAPDLDKPVVNILRRPVNLFIASIVSDDVGVQVTTFNTGPGDKAMLDMISSQFAEVMELARVKSKFRDFVRDSAVDGDGCMHYYFDPGPEAAAHKADAEAGDGQGEPDAAQPLKGTPGQIQAEILNNTEVFFGNPQLHDVEKQPWIIIAFRRLVEEVQEVAKAENKADVVIEADQDINGINTETENGKVTVLRKYYKQGGTVWFTEVTQSAVVRPPKDTGYRLYPLVWMPWEKVKNRYHGQAALTGMIPNQIFVNKLEAMAMQHVKMMAFPKVVYDKTKIPGGWNNAVGAAIGVSGPPGDIVATPTLAPSMNDQVMVMLDKTISMTRESMGANDAVLGNIKPDNTSAIIAVQKQTAMPLELQKMSFYQAVEDSVRIWLEMMAENYGVRPVEMVRTEEEPAPAMGIDPAMEPQGAGGEENGTEIVMFDFSRLKGMNLRLNVDIGAATYWSELMQAQTLDGLYMNQIITDPEDYLTLMPSGYLPDKTLALELVRKRKAEAKAAEEAALAAQMMAQQPQMPQQVAELPPEMAAMPEEAPVEMVDGEIPPEVVEAAAEMGIDPAAAMEMLLEGVRRE